MISNEQATGLIGQQMVGTDGSKIGKVGQVFLDQDTGLPEFATVATGLFGSSESFVPLAQASVSGDKLTVPYDKAKVKGAPRMEADSELSQAEEAKLYSYYGLGYTEQASGSGLPTTAGQSTAPQAAAPQDAAPPVAPAPATTTAPQAPAPRNADGQMSVTRSEERLSVGTQRVESGRVRLRKHIVTENVAAQVQVSSEQARVSREPITDANRTSAMAGAEITEAEHEVVLTAERPVVEKEVVPVERVRLGKEQVSEQVTVSDQVRSEQVEMLEQTGDGQITRTDVDSDQRH